MCFASLHPGPITVRTGRINVEEGTHARRAEAGWLEKVPPSPLRSALAAVYKLGFRKFMQMPPKGSLCYLTWPWKKPLKIIFPITDPADKEIKTNSLLWKPLLWIYKGVLGRQIISEKGMVLTDQRLLLLNNHSLFRRPEISPSSSEAQLTRETYFLVYSLSIILLLSNY